MAAAVEEAGWKQMSQPLEMPRRQSPLEIKLLWLPAELLSRRGPWQMATPVITGIISAVALPS